MDELARKLNLKPRMTIVVVEPAVDLDLGDVTSIEDSSAADAVLVFAANREELAARADLAIDAAARDAVVWIAYPKGGQLDTDLSRDVLWEWASEHGIRPVRQVAIDAVWSALRFRPGLIRSSSSKA